MLFADQIQPLEVVITIAMLLGLGLFALFLVRGYERLARRSLERKYADLDIPEEPRPGDVTLTYHTYHGLIAWFTQTPHHATLPPDDARKLLGRLLRFNCTWGLVTYGCLFIPPIAVLNYLAQRRSIANQEADSAMAEFSVAARPASTESAGREFAQSPSLFYRVAGWILVGFCVIFAISAAAGLMAAEFKGAMGLAVITVLFAWTARDWLRKGRGVRQGTSECPKNDK